MSICSNVSNILLLSKRTFVLLQWLPILSFGTPRLQQIVYSDLEKLFDYRWLSRLICAMVSLNASWTKAFLKELLIISSVILLRIVQSTADEPDLWSICEAVGSFVDISHCRWDANRLTNSYTCAIWCDGLTSNINTMFDIVILTIISRPRWLKASNFIALTKVYDEHLLPIVYRIFEISWLRAYQLKQFQCVEPHLSMLTC